MHLIASSTALFLVVSAPLVARADDEPPAAPDDVVAPAPVDEARAPVEEAPAPPAATPPVAPTHEGTWCDYHHSGWYRPFHPRFAIGFAHSHVDGDLDGSQKSLLARGVLRHGFEVELELAKLTLGDDKAKTAEGTLVKTFGHHHLFPYVLAGAGGGKLDRADGTDAHLKFAEIGGGVMLRLRHFAIGADIRKGVRSVDGAEMDTAARMTTTSSESDHDHYTRGRILALVYF